MNKHRCEWIKWTRFWNTIPRCLFQSYLQAAALPPPPPLTFPLKCIQPRHLKWVTKPVSPSARTFSDWAPRDIRWNDFMALQWIQKALRKHFVQSKAKKHKTRTSFNCSESIFNFWTSAEIKQVCFWVKDLNSALKLTDKSVCRPLLQSTDVIVSPDHANLDPSSKYQYIDLT